MNGQCMTLKQPLVMLQGKTVLFMLGSSRRLMYPITNTAAYEIRKTAQDIACELKILYGITDRSTLLKIPIKF